MVIIPKYEPVFVEPNLKEYETQVNKILINVVLTQVRYECG